MRMACIYFLYQPQKPQADKGYSITFQQKKSLCSDFPDGQDNRLCWSHLPLLPGKYDALLLRRKLKWWWVADLQPWKLMLELSRSSCQTIMIWPLESTFNCVTVPLIKQYFSFTAESLKVPCDVRTKPRSSILISTLIIRCSLHMWPSISRLLWALNPHCVGRGLSPVSPSALASGLLFGTTWTLNLSGPAFTHSSHKRTQKTGKGTAAIQKHSIGSSAASRSQMV